VPELKKNPKGKLINAFAKTDEFMQKLPHHPNARVRQLAQAKLDVQSSLLETRLLRLAGIASRGAWPVHLNFCGAKNTSRMSGGDKVNAQNFTKGTPLRSAVVAPEGHKLVVVDSDKIELRISMWLAEQEDMIEALTLGQDPYSLMASKIYGRAITKKDIDQRQLGKIAMLALGYGMGLGKFVDTVRNWGLTVENSLLATAHRAYRSSMVSVIRGWDNSTHILHDINNPSAQVATYPDFLMAVKGGIMVKPSGFIIKYPGLKASATGWSYGDNVNLWGGKVFENICQCVAAHIIGEQTRVLRRRWDIAMQAHDELVAVVPEDRAQACLDDMIDVMRQPPTWWPDLMLNATGKIVDNYGDAK
jgi:DNA polymerase